MSSRFEHPSYFGRFNRSASAADECPATPETAAAPAPSPPHLQGACCCPAPPAVIVLIPANDGHGQVDLLLCGHHYRQSRRALAASGAALADLKGEPLTSEMWPAPAC